MASGRKSFAHLTGHKQSDYYAAMRDHRMQLLLGVVRVPKGDGGTSFQYEFDIAKATAYGVKLRATMLEKRIAAAKHAAKSKDIGETTALADRLRRKCSHCGTYVSRAAKRCGSCGKSPNLARHGA
jgi:hypothetical protein